MMRALFAAVLLFAASAADAAPVVVSDAWLRALPGALPAAGYFKLHNGTAKTIALTGAKSSACGELMLHRSRSEGGMAMMEDAPAVPVPPGQNVTFAPGGYHLMCVSPHVRIGETVPITLTFAGGATVEARFHVRGATGQ